MEELKRTVKVYDQNVILDNSKLYFSENTISEYLEQEGAWIAYFGAKLCDAERQHAEIELEVERADDEYDRTYSRIFALIKDTEGKSDKYTEGAAKIDPTVVAAKQKFSELKAKLIESKHVARLIYQHLKAWDKNHENVQNRGNTLRREMDRLNKDVMYSVDDIVKEVDITR